ncbi:MAG: hypothetical protein DWQ07_09535 [Chloroflexi bacterium]|nr:MAG: hypothetical protein DWQ07_09535 [Chloroflexota bacterium]MBL1193045.1 hypothetical protein [Chloroflexota bacterium]NOH10338.1 hypothetical protein [Chloroflexota bacterium]
MTSSDIVNVQTRVPLSRAVIASVITIGFVLICTIFSPASERGRLLSLLFIYSPILLLTPFSFLASLNFYGYYRLTQSGIEVAKHTPFGRRWIFVPWGSVQRVKHEEKIRHGSKAFLHHVWGIEVNKTITWQNRRIARIMQMDGHALLVTSDHTNHDLILLAANENAIYPIPEEDLALFPVVYR